MRSAGGARGIEADAELEASEGAPGTAMVHNRNRAEIEAAASSSRRDVLREAVRRDIEALFNTERFESCRCYPLEGEVPQTTRRRWPIFRRCGAASSTTACPPSPAARPATSTAKTWRAR